MNTIEHNEKLQVLRLGKQKEPLVEVNRCDFMMIVSSSLIVNVGIKIVNTKNS